MSLRNPRERPEQRGQRQVKVLCQPGSRGIRTNARGTQSNTVPEAAEINPTAFFKLGATLNRATEARFSGENVRFKTIVLGLDLNHRSWARGGNIYSAGKNLLFVLLTLLRLGKAQHDLGQAVIYD